MQNLESTRDAARKLIKQSPMQEFQELLEPLLQPSIRLQIQSTQTAATGIGESRIGGLPDVPRDWEWPGWDGYPIDNPYLTREPTALSFLAQINLSDFEGINLVLPKAGLLSFFYDTVSQPWGYDPRDRDAFRVEFFDGDIDRFRPADFPTEFSDEHHFHGCRISPQLEMTLPDWLEQFDYQKHRESYEKLKRELNCSDEGIQHRLLGHPQVIQGDMQQECQLVSHGINCGSPAGYSDPRVEQLSQSAGDWQLLLQIDSDEENPGWMWGDLGRVYFWIRKQDLAERRFDRVWTILQCS